MWICECKCSNAQLLVRENRGATDDCWMCWLLMLLRTSCIFISSISSHNQVSMYFIHHKQKRMTANGHLIMRLTLLILLFPFLASTEEKKEAQQNGWFLWISYQFLCAFIPAPSSNSIRFRCDWLKCWWLNQLFGIPAMAQGYTWGRAKKQRQFVPKPTQFYALFSVITNHFP